MDLSGIKNFQKKLKSYANTENNEIALKIAEQGVEIAKNYYSGTDISVYAERSGLGRARIIAEGKDVYFEEYGTGWVGEGKYPGELPTNTFVFESAGKIRSTQGWVYHYPNTDTKRPKDNPDYWWYNGQKQKGKAPNAQMWKTSRDLREKFTEITKTVLNAERDNKL